MDEIKKTIVGGAVVLVIGGTGFAVSQTDIASNFAQETGVSQQEAQKYVEDSKDDLESFSKIGQDFVDDGSSLLETASGIDCANYTYEWESPSLNCDDGKSQMQTVGNGEINLGNCFKALETDLGESAKPKIRECISDIDTLNSSYDLPIVAVLMNSNDVAESKKSNLYNKSVLRAALEAE